MNRLLQGDVGRRQDAGCADGAVDGGRGGRAGRDDGPDGNFGPAAPSRACSPLAEAAGVRLEILTGRDKGAERAAKLADRWPPGTIQILVGTHAVFQPDVVFADLRLAVIDEQHRFGVAQRMELGAKGQAVDVLVMTATPIPRSLALTHYGDMDLSVLDEKPPGRTPVTTALISTERLAEVVGRLRSAVAEGRQCLLGLPVGRRERGQRHDRRRRAVQALLRAELGRRGQVGLVHGQLPPPTRTPPWPPLPPERPRCWWRRR